MSPCRAEAPALRKGMVGVTRGEVPNNSGRNAFLMHATALQNPSRIHWACTVSPAHLIPRLHQHTPGGSQRPWLATCRSGARPVAGRLYAVASLLRGDDEQGRWQAQNVPEIPER